MKHSRRNEWSLILGSHNPYHLTAKPYRKFFSRNISWGLYKDPWASTEGAAVPSFQIEVRVLWKEAYDWETKKGIGPSSWAWFRNHPLNRKVKATLHPMGRKQKSTIIWYPTATHSLMTGITCWEIACNMAHYNLKAILSKWVCPSAFLSPKSQTWLCLASEMRLSFILTLSRAVKP